jgi:hypothetical protein
MKQTISEAGMRLLQLYHRENGAESAIEFYDVVSRNSSHPYGGVKGHYGR